MQMTRDGIVHLAFHPRSDTLVLAAADKGGHVGLWHVDRESFPAPEAVETSRPTADDGEQAAAGGASGTCSTCLSMVVPIVMLFACACFQSVC